MSLILSTSGTTKEPKLVNHSWSFIEHCIQASIREIHLTSKDIVLDVFPQNTIAHYTVTAMPAYRANAILISTKFNAEDYIQKFKQYNPTYIALIPRHWELLREQPEWEKLDMSSVRYMVTGSGPVTQLMIDDFLNKGVKLVANWYGMTEFPPPVLVGYNSESFDIKPKSIGQVTFDKDGECFINNIATGDIFDLRSMKFLKRKSDNINENTWKNS